MRVRQDVLRKLLERVEALPEPGVATLAMADAGPGTTPDVTGDDERRHLRLLVYGGYLAVCRSALRAAPAYMLTIEGQRLLDSLRAPPAAARSIGEIAQRVLTGIAVGLLVAKGQSIGIDLLG